MKKAEKIENPKIRVIQVCPEIECDNNPVLNVEIGNRKHNFCCQKGFKKSLQEFNQYVSKSQ